MRSPAGRTSLRSWRLRPNTTRNSPADHSPQPCVVDEYVALRVLAGDWPAEIPLDVLGLTYARHWRLLSALAVPTVGRISRGLAALSSEDREQLRRALGVSIVIVAPPT